MQEKLEPCSLAMKCTGNFEHFKFLVSCFDVRNRFFAYDYFNEKYSLVMWNFTNRKNMTEFIEPLKKEINSVLGLLKSEKMTIPDISLGIYNPQTETLLILN